ncbi:hypothetical protein HN682_00680 [Candidatus Peregrinibacteria bacterium]|nr:hypothetical protein [Candidatus Peregrinibacteria bacterium]
MAELNKFTAKESLNAETNANWDPQTAITCTNTVEGVHSVSPGVMTVFVQPTSLSYIRYTWSTSTATSGVIDETKDLLFKVQWYESLELRVPRNVGPVPVLHLLNYQAGSKTIKIVEA